MFDESCNYDSRYPVNPAFDDFDTQVNPEEREEFYLDWFHYCADNGYYD